MHCSHWSSRKSFPKNRLLLWVSVAFFSGLFKLRQCWMKAYNFNSLQRPYCARQKVYFTSLPPLFHLFSSMVSTVFSVFLVLFHFFLCFLIPVLSMAPSPISIKGPSEVSGSVFIVHWSSRWACWRPINMQRRVLGCLGKDSLSLSDWFEKRKWDKEPIIGRAWGLYRESERPCYGCLYMDT